MEVKIIPGHLTFDEARNALSCLTDLMTKMDSKFFNLPTDGNNGFNVAFGTRLKSAKSLIELLERYNKNIEHEVSETCPDCGRKKAHSAQDMQDGLCPKWYAITDKEADEDCEKFKG